MPDIDSRVLGAWGEGLAAEYLRRRGYRIVAGRYRCRYGEIDIVARNWRYLVFVEVKLRKDADFALAREYVDSHKQRRLRLAAQCYLAAHPCRQQPRFDVIEIYAPEGAYTRHPQINHMEDAFE